MSCLKLKQIFIFVAIIISFSCHAIPNFPVNNEILTSPVKDSLTGDSFDYSLQLIQTSQLYKVYKMSFPAPVKGESLFGDVSGFYYVPLDLDNNSAARPGVLCLHILGGDGSLTKLICAHLAANGIPAMMCHAPMFADRLKAGKRSEVLASPHACRILGMALLEAPLDARRTIDIMCSRSEINPDRIGILGTSMGGLTAATVAGSDTRIDKAAILLAGGDLRSIIYSASRESQSICQAIEKASPEDRKFIEHVFGKIEPLNNIKGLQKLAKRNNLIIINAENDQIITAEFSQKLVDACGLTGKNTVLPGLDHYTAIASLPKLLNDFVIFFADKTVPPQKPLELSGDKKIIQNVFTQFHKLFEFKAQSGKCIYIVSTINIKDTKNNKIIFNGSVEIMRGDEKQFKLILVLKQSPLGDKFSHLEMGYDSSPWLISNNGTLYLGQLEPQENSFPAKYLTPRLTQFQQLLTGMFSMAAAGMFTPFDKLVKIELKDDSNGQRFVAIDEKNSQAKIYLDKSNELPQKILINSKSFSAEFVFTQWNLAAPAPPGIFGHTEEKVVKTIEVEQYHLDRMFAALANFVISKL